MLRIIRYSFADLIRSRWLYFYTGFYLVLTGALFFISADLSKVIVSLMNAILFIVPLVALLFGVMVQYNTREFTELLLAQPIPRRSIFLGQYLGIATALAISFLLGAGIPFVISGIFLSSEIWNFTILLISGVLLSYIFSALGYLLALINDNRIRGFGLAILVWLLLAVVYDGLFLLGLAWFSDYPLENVAIGVTVFNPIDLARILILLKLDVSALMGYTGAVFNKFLGTSLGMGLALTILVVWAVLPVSMIRYISLRKDF